ncbi:MAG: hypothetical protein D6767_01090 [Candidatus Hydrogenedentota bacterium]|nr:MAG: hypothetical protein D6767_01090 [Candidatus Hydrogenedentota bacterium]
MGTMKKVLILGVVVIGMLPFSLWAKKFQKTQYFNVKVLGINVGFARLRTGYPQPCPKPQGLVKKEKCVLYEYSVNLNKMQMIGGAMRILSKAYVIQHEWIPHYIVTKYDIAGKKTMTSLFYNYKQNQVILQDLKKKITKKIVMPPNAHSLATLPIYYGRSKHPKLSGFVMGDTSFQKFQVRIREEKKKGTLLRRVFQKGSEYIRVKSGTDDIQYVRLLPIKVFGMQLGNIDAERVVKQKKK